MKKFVILLMTVLMAATMVVSVSAAGAESTEILKGTPVVDGALDDIYTQSAVYEANGEGGSYFPMGGFSGAIQHTAKAYFLWDNDYLYICTVTADPTTMSSGDGTWFNDASEHWFVDEALTYKVHAAADGTFFLGEDGDGKCAYDFSAAKSAATMTDAGWVTEIALPLNNLAAGRELTYRLQVNDIISAGKGYANNGNPDVKMVCAAGEVVVETPVEILKGTPVVDGVFDDIYTQSAVYEANGEGGSYFPMGGFSGAIQHTAKAYFLWDNDYLYICTVTADPTTMSSGDGTWFNDASEHWFVDEALTYKVHAAADGTFFLGEDGDGKCAYDFSAAKSAATMTDAGWVTEIALPLNNLVAGRELTYRLQVNDIISAGKGYANNGNPDVKMVCAAGEVVVETETEAPVEAPVAPETEAPEVVDVPVAPQTFDAGVIAVVAAIVSAAGYMISKKR